MQLSSPPNMHQTVTAVSSAFYRDGLVLGACLGLICALYLYERYLQKQELSHGIRVLALLSCVITGTVLGVAVGSVLPEIAASYQGSERIIQKGI